ncbi:hypothetical protein EDC02_5503 [Micromonospora sp. Llam0]|uniref:hypothetical protein n=1 Tax=Micromonospora sp. Llam0 TaxID=2485143 RepID=UPI000F487281|nr:hypothetical protein [Micromonospora sp. Llam0]ROO50652.1 hypothetical protein EDC02_5503 [Micromonospora sp. Llam0]
MREIELREIRQNASELVCHAQADELATALSRIIVGEQVAKMPDIATIAWATGHTVAQLTGLVEVAERVQVAAASHPA